MSALETLIAEQEQAGGFVTDEFAAEGTPEHALHLANEAWRRSRGTSPTSGAERFGFEKATALLARVIAPLVWIVRGFIPERAVLVIAGEPKTSKTWLALTFALAISALRGLLVRPEDQLFGQFPVPSPDRREVAYFALEDSERSFKTRLTALARGMGLEPLKAVEHVHVKCRASLNLLSDADLCGLAAACPKDLALLIIDPLRDAHPGEENDSGDMSEVMSRLRFLRDYLGCAVLFVHHTAKMGPSTAGRRPGQMMRGSTAIHGAVDGGIYLAMTKASEVEWTNTVMVELKAGKGAGTFGLTLNVEDDANGEASVARWTYSAEPTAKGADELETNIQRVVDMLREAHRDSAPGCRGRNRETIRKTLMIGMPKANAAVNEAIQRGLLRYDKDEGGATFIDGEPS